ncbi:MAG TPA: hypothetical protein VEH27_16490 [Methylomirabilota bacterium]|nr:hypothetical protein [Methylomirabilota bacterium]
MKLLASSARFFRGLLLCCSVHLLALLIAAAPPAEFKKRAEEIYTAAEAAFRKDSENATNGWLFARACFDLAEFSETKVERERLAKLGIAAAEAAIKAAPNGAAGHYYLALNKGQLARTKTLGALPLVEQMEKHLQSAASHDKSFDYGGPDRSLGLLYLDAPGWPTSIGNKKKARQHLEYALTLHPEFPENQLCMIEGLIKSGDKIRARRALPSAEEAMTEGRKIFTGERWEQSWADWEKRLAAFKAELR